MKKERIEQIEKEAERRLSEWLKHSTFNEMTVYGSFMRFNMAIGLIGYPLKKEEWMKDKDFNRFVTDDEYDSPYYDEIMSNLFDKANRLNHKPI